MYKRVWAQTDEQEVINFLLTTEIIPLCLKIMESGSELSKTVRISVVSSLFRVTTCMQKLEMSGNLTTVRDVTKSQGSVRKKSCQGKVA